MRTYFLNNKALPNIIVESMSYSSVFPLQVSIIRCFNAPCTGHYFWDQNFLSKSPEACALLEPFFNAFWYTAPFLLVTCLLCLLSILWSIYAIFCFDEHSRSFNNIMHQPGAKREAEATADDTTNTHKRGLYTETDSDSQEETPKFTGQLLLLVLSTLSLFTGVHLYVFSTYSSLHKGNYTDGVWLCAYLAICGVISAALSVAISSSQSSEYRHRYSSADTTAHLE